MKLLLAISVLLCRRVIIKKSQCSLALPYYSDFLVNFSDVEIRFFLAVASCVGGGLP